MTNQIFEEHDAMQEYLFGKEHLYTIWISNSITGGKYSICTNWSVKSASMEFFAFPYTNTLDNVKLDIVEVMERELQLHPESIFRISKISKYLVDGKVIPIEHIKEYK